MRPVTDPAILSQLEAGEGNLRPVTDPALIAQLEGDVGPTLKQRLGNVPFAMQGAGETALQMFTGFAGAVPAAVAGVHNAFREGTPTAYAPAFHAVQEALTYAPRTEMGKNLSGAVGDLFHKYSSGVDYVADRTPGGPLAQTAVKTTGEAIPLVAPFLPGMFRGRRPVERAAERPEAPASPVAPDAALTAKQPMAGGLKPVNDPAILAELEGQPVTVRPGEPFPGKAIPQRPLYELTPEEIRGEIGKSDAAWKSVTDELFGAEGQRYRSLASRDSGYDAATAMEGRLSPEQYKRLEAAQREGISPDEANAYLKAYNDARMAETPQELGSSLRWAITKIGEQTDPAKMGFKERAAWYELKSAMEYAKERGWDTAEISRSAIEGAASRFRDPADAEFMLQRFAKAPEVRAPLALERPTEAGLREQAERLDVIRLAGQDAIRAQEQKALADSQVKDFELTGSERQADINPRQAELKPVDDPALIQQLESANVTEINVRQRKVKPPTIDYQSDSISSAVSKLGGLDPSVMQDVAATGKGAFRDVKGFNYLSKKGGKSADEMAELLHERGYLAARDTNELFAKLDDELRAGQPTHFSNRQNVDRYMESLLERKYGPSGQLYSGIPFDKAADTIKFAGQKLGDALGVPTKGVEVQTKPPHPRSMSILDQMRSPSELVGKYPEFKPYVERAQKAQVEMDTLRDAFSRRLQYVDNQLGGRILDKAGDLGSQYRANKKTLNELLLEGDFEGKRFTKAELDQRGIPQNIQNAYFGIRSAYDHALSIANQTRALRGKEAVSKREGYIPHFFHDYFIKVDGEIIASARTLREAVSMANDAARSKAGEVVVTPKGMRFPGEETQAAIVGDATYFKLREAMEDAFSMTSEQANALLNDIARMRGRSRVVGNFLERKGAPGWERNLDYAHRHYFNMISRYAALDKFKSSTISNFEMRYGQFDKEYKGTAKYIKDYINDINGVPTRIEELIDSAITNLPGMKQFAQQFLGDRPALEMATATTNAVAIAKLGLYNVSSALVNLSQMNMAQSVLGPKWFAEGAKKAAAVEFELGKRKLGAGGATTPDIGILRQLDVPIQQGLEHSGVTPTGKLGAVFKASTYFFNNVEFANRATTSLGAYYKALSEGRSKAEALEYARDINRRVNFDYSLADTPNFIRRSGPAGQVLFQFKKFPIKAMEFMTHLKGAENARFWVPFVLVSGYYAFPGMDAVKNMVKGLFGLDIELESKDWLIRWAGDDPQKKAIAKTIFYGAFSHDSLGGVDVSRRVGGGDFIPSELNDLFGPFFSSAVRATQMAASEHWVEALREIATAPGNIAIALRNDGEITSPWDRDRLTTKLDTKGRVLKGLGFATTQESKERDTARVMRYNERQQRDNEKEAIDGYIKAYLSQDQAGMQKAVTRIGELGMQNAGKRIAEEMQKKGMPVSERAFDNLSRAGKLRQAPLLEHVR